MDAIGLEETTPQSQGSLHTQDWRPVTVAFEDLSLVGKAEPSKFTSHQKGRRPKGPKKSLYGLLHGRLWTMFHGLLEFASNLFSLEKFHLTKGHFVHETEGMWPLHFKISHWLKMPNYQSLLHTGRWRCKGPKKSVHGLLHGILWIMVHGLLEFASYLLPLEKPHIRVTSYTRVKACDHCIWRSLSGRKGRTIQVHFTPKGEGLRAQRKVYMDCYMTDYG